MEGIEVLSKKGSYKIDQIFNQGSSFTEVFIILPTYNSEEFIIRSLTSIYLQKTKYKYKVIVIDDCSQDKTIEAVIEYSINTNICIEIWRSQKNIGAGKCRGFAIGRNRSRYVAFIDSDDEWLPEKLQSSIDSHVKYKCQLVCHPEFYRKNNSDSLLYLKENYEPVDKSNLELSLRYLNYISTSTVTIDTETIKRFNFSSRRYCEDYETWLNLSIFNKFHLHDSPLGVLNENPHGLSDNRKEIVLGHIVVIIKTLFSSVKCWGCKSIIYSVAGIAKMIKWYIFNEKY